MRRRTGAVLAAAAVAVSLSYAFTVLGNGAPGSPPGANITGSGIPGIVSGNNELAIRFYQQVSDGDENVFFSPVGIYIAFSALYEGARHDTARQILDTLGLEPDTAARHAAVSQFTSHINWEDPNTTLSVASALWLAERFEVYDSYVEPVRDHYGAHVEALDLPGSGERMIDAWVADSTNGAIKDVVSSRDLTVHTVAVITNAVYFTGEWEHRFPQRITHMGTFWKNDSSGVEAHFMSNEGLFYHAALDDAQMLRLPYKGDRLSMLVILPDDRDGIGQLGESLGAGVVARWKERMVLTDVTISMPKFTMSPKYDLKAVLGGLGITDVFDAGLSDLSGIGDAGGLPVFVSSASQKTFVDVDEVGTEAAATTMAAAKAVEQRQSTKFVVDHPFIFVIHDDETGAILFMGRVSDPTA